MRALATFCAVALLAAPAAMAQQAASPAAAPLESCLQSQASLQVIYTLSAPSFSEAQKLAAEQHAKIAKLAEQQKIAKFQLQNDSSNISAQPGANGLPGTPYQVSGSLSYTLESADQAAKFADFLTAQKFQVNISTNTFRNC